MMYHIFPPSFPNPPCAKSGRALPMIFHLSHWMMTTAYADADRVGTMNGEWTRLKVGPSIHLFIYSHHHHHHVYVVYRYTKHILRAVYSSIHTTTTTFT